MGIAIILFNLRCFRLKYSTAAAGIIVLFFCSSLWGYIPNLQEKRLPVSFPSTCKGPIAEDQLIRSDSGGFAKRGSNNQLFQQWQDLSPDEQEKMRKKYKEWQSLPPEEQQLIRRRMNQLNKMPYRSQFPQSKKFNRPQRTRSSQSFFSRTADRLPAKKLTSKYSTVDITLY